MNPKPSALERYFAVRIGFGRENMGEALGRLEEYLSRVIVFVLENIARLAI